MIVDDTINSRNDPIGGSTCLYLALGDDPKTQAAFPSSENYCYRCDPKAIPKFEHQRDICLTAKHVTCPIYKNPPGNKMPSEIRNNQTRRLPIKPTTLFITIIILFGVIAGFIFGFWQDIFGPNQEQPDQQTTASGYIFMTETPLSTSTTTPMPTIALTSTPVPTNTLTPSITPTLACNFSLEYFGTSNSSEDRFLISFYTPTELTKHLKDEEQRQIPLEISLPEFELMINGEKTNNYWTYMRDLNSPNFLFVEFFGNPDDTVQLQYQDQGVRYCSQPIIVMIYEPLPQTTPTP